MWYVYVIRSVSSPAFIYIGYTGNLDNRLTQHNKGLSPSTRPYKLFKIDFYMTFKNEAQAKKVESYFKTGSGKAI